MTPTSACMAVVHDTVAVCAPDGGLITWKISVRMDAVVPESLPATSVPATPPRLAVIFVALLAFIATMIIAARLAPLPTTNAGVVTDVTLQWNPESTALSKTTCASANPGTAASAHIAKTRSAVSVTIARRTSMGQPPATYSERTCVLPQKYKRRAEPAGRAGPERTRVRRHAARRLGGARHRVADVRKSNAITMHARQQRPRLKVRARGVTPPGLVRGSTTPASTSSRSPARYGAT